MKIKVEKTALIDSLKKATSFIGLPKNDVVSISTDENKNVVLKVSTLTKISQGVTFSAKISADVEEEGGVAVCANKLYQIAKLLKGDTISITDVDDEYIFVTDGYSKIKFPPEKDLQKLPEIFYTDTIEVTASNFKKLVNKTSFACDKTGYKKVIHLCINFSATNDGFLQASATDSSRMAYNSCPCTQSENPVNFNAYVSEIQSFANILPNSDKKIKIEIGTADNIFAKFSFGKFELLTVLYEEKFPDIMQVFSFKKPIAILDTKKFKNTLDAMTLITKHCNHNQIYLNFSGDLLKLTAESKEFGKCESTIDCFELAENAFIPVNSIYLADAVKQISSPKSPIIITSNTIQITDGKFFCIIAQLKDPAKKLPQSEIKQIDPPTVDVTTAA